MQLDDVLLIEENPWRGRLIALAFVVALGIGAAVAAYYFFLRDEAETTRATEDIEVKRATIGSSLIIAGTADTQLNSDLAFETSGKVVALNVKVGDVVQQGQVLAALQSDDLQNGVLTARASLTAAQLKLDDLLAGSTEAELAAADQAVQLARSQLAAAISAREKLSSTPSAADIAAAEAGVASAQSALTAARNSATSASNTVSSTAASLKSAEASYCVADATPSFCAAQATPIGAADLNILNTALNGANATLASAAIAANTAYMNAVNASASAAAAVTSAEDALASAEARLDSVAEGPTAEEFAAADAAIASADSSLASAEARQREAIRGSEPNAIAQARQAVESARLALLAAQIRVADSQIIAPFDGTVAAVNIAVGEFVGPAAATPALVLLTPERVLLDISLGETDYAAVKVGLGGVVLFDAIPGRPYPFTISEIGLSPTVTQGVVTYRVKASLVVLPGSPLPAPGMNGRGQVTTEQRPDVIAIPPRAIRRKGAEQVVDVRRDGTVVEQVITTGLSDTENVEVLTGLAEGDVLVVPSLIASDASSSDVRRTPLPGGVR